MRLTRKEKIKISNEIRSAEKKIQKREKNKKEGYKSILYGVFAFMFFIYFLAVRNNQISITELIEIDGVLLENVTVQKTGRSNYSSDFKLLNYSGINFIAYGLGVNKVVLEEITGLLRKGDKVTFFVLENELNELSRKNDKEIKIYGIRKGMTTFFDLEDYNLAEIKERKLFRNTSLIISLGFWGYGLFLLIKSFATVF